MSSLINSIILIAKPGLGIDTVKRAITETDVAVGAHKEKTDIIVVIPAPSSDMDMYRNIIKDMNDIEILLCPEKLSYEMAARTGMESALGDRIIVIDMEEDAGFLVRTLIEPKSTEDLLTLTWSHRRLEGPLTKVAGRVAGALGAEDALLMRSFVISRRATALALDIGPDFEGLGAALRSEGRTTRTLSIGGSFGPRPSARRLLGVALNRSAQSGDSAIRLLTVMAFISAIINITYAVWIIIVNIFSSKVADGWSSTGLHMSLMFFLLSLMAGVMGEYLVQIRRSINGSRIPSVNSIRSSQSNINQRLNVTFKKNE